MTSVALIYSHAIRDDNRGIVWAQNRPPPPRRRNQHPRKSRLQPKGNVTVSTHMDLAALNPRGIASLTFLMMATKGQPNFQKDLFKKLVGSKLYHFNAETMAKNYS